MSNCRECAYWEKMDYEKYAAYGLCHHPTTSISNHTQGAQPNGMWADETRANVTVGPDFGCVHFEKIQIGIGIVGGLKALESLNPFVRTTNEVEISGIKCRVQINPQPLRFRNQDDALRFLDCKDPDERSRLIVPCAIRSEGKLRINPEWKEAPFEMVYVYTADAEQAILFQNPDIDRTI